MNLHSTLL